MPLYLSNRSRALPVPRTTQVSGSSAINTGKPVSSINKRSISRNNAPPPVRTIPFLAISEPSSGGVCSSAIFTALTILLSGSVRASRTSLLEMVKLRDLHFAHFTARKGRTDFFLNLFGGGFANQHAIVAANVINNCLVELVSTDTYGTGIHRTA